MITLLNILCFLVAILVLVDIRKTKFSIAKILLIEFDVAYVLPTLVEAFIGTAPLHYYGFRLALDDDATMLVYFFFILITEVLFWRYIKKSNGAQEAANDVVTEFLKARKSLTKNCFIEVIVYLMLVLPLLALCFSPDPLVYFSELGPFIERSEDMDLASSYHRVIMGRCVSLSALGVVLCKITDINNLWYKRVIRIISLICIAWLNGKRTLFTILIMVILAIDLISKKIDYKLILKVIIAAFIVLTYFFVYAYITGKIYYSNTLYSMISEYFFKSNAVKVAIYSNLHPSLLKVLDYPLQTIIYDLCYFIPRSIWDSKPYPYPDYYSSAVMGLSELTYFGWRFQTNIYAEFISNFNILGIFFAPLFILWMCKKMDQSKGILFKLLGLVLAISLQVFEYTDSNKVLMLVWTIILLKNEVFRKKVSFKK